MRDTRRHFIMEAKYEIQKFDESEQTFAPYSPRKEAAWRMMDRKKGARASCALACASCANPPSVRAGCPNRRAGSPRSPFSLESNLPHSAATSKLPWMTRRLTEPAGMAYGTSGGWGAPRAMRSPRRRRIKRGWLHFGALARIIEYVCRFCRARRDAQPGGGTPPPAQDGLIRFD